MPENNDTTIGVTGRQRKELDEVVEFLEENGYPKPSLKDAIFHLLDFWQQNREDKGNENRAPEQTVADDDEV